MTKTFIAVREVNTEVYRKFRAVAIQEKIKVGMALTMAMQGWIIENNKKMKKKDVRNLLKIKPFDFGPNSEKLSEEIDDVLYGTKGAK
ncbi:MAG: hypothetical protein AABX96_01895 [Nanoarchaeota archaeon]